MENSKTTPTTVNVTFFTEDLPIIQEALKSLFKHASEACEEIGESGDLSPENYKKWLKSSQIQMATKRTFNKMVEASNSISK